MMNKKLRRISFVVIAVLTLWYITMQFTATAQVPTETACHYTFFNLQGSSGADIAVSSSAVLVLTGNAYICQALIYNNSSNTMRCGGSDVTATTNGQVVPGNSSLSLAYEAMKDWYCIRTGGSDAAANVTERRSQ